MIDSLPPTMSAEAWRCPRFTTLLVPARWALPVTSTSSVPGWTWIQIF